MNYYVILRRFMKKEDIVSLYDEPEAIKRGWVDQNGNRVWVVALDEEYTPTFMWKFSDLDEAIMFYELLRTSDFGVPCYEV